MVVDYSGRMSTHPPVPVHVLSVCAAHLHGGAASLGALKLDVPARRVGWWRGQQWNGKAKHAQATTNVFYLALPIADAVWIR